MRKYAAVLLVLLIAAVGCSLTGWQRGTSECSVSVTLQSISLVYNDHVGNEWSFFARVNQQEWEVVSGLPYTILQQVSQTSPIALEICAKAVEHDAVPDVGQACESVEVQCPSSGRNEQSLTLSVRVTENRGRYSGNSAVWDFNFIITAEAQLSTPPAPPPVSQAVVTLHFIDVGQGDSIYLESNDGFNALIDTGDWPQHGSVVLSYLEGLGVNKLGVLVATHQDADHIGGHPEVIEYFMARGGIEQIWDSGLPSTSQTAERYLEAVESYGDRLEVVFPVAGEEYSWGEHCRALILNPPEGHLPGGDLNENSIVIRLVCGAVAFLLPGDAGAQAEEAMLAAGYQLSSTVLKLGHHGSNSATTPPFLEAVNPLLAVISAPQDSQFGHPHDEVLNRLCDRGTTTYWTGIHGTIRMSVAEDGAISVSTEHEATTDPCQMSALKG